MRRTISVLLALIILLTILTPASAAGRQETLVFQAPGALLLTPGGPGVAGCSRKSGDLYIQGSGYLMDKAGSVVGGYTIDCEVAKIIRTTDRRVYSRLLEGTMTVTLATGGWFKVRYNGPSVQELATPKATPYPGLVAWLWWEGKGRVTATSPDLHAWKGAKFEWDGYVVYYEGQVPPPMDMTQPLPFLSVMRFSP